MSLLAATLPNAATAAVAPTKMFRVTVTLVPTVLVQLPPIYLNLLLGANRSAGATAWLGNFAYVGGAVTTHWMNSGAKGDFASTIRMQCRAAAAAPQAIGAVAPTLQRFWFDLGVTADPTTDDAFTLWLLDQRATWLPSTAKERPGLFASVNWRPGGPINWAGYVGNGTIGDLPNLGFGATVEPL